MAPARSLHEIITGLTGDAGTSGDLATVLRANGHPDLPPDLVAEAVVSFADTAPAEIAEHLAPFVTAHGPIADGDAAAGDVGQLTDLLATAPAAEPDVTSPREMSDIDAPADNGGPGPADLLDEVGHDTEDVPSGPASVPPDTGFGLGADSTRMERADEMAFDAVAAESAPDGNVDTPQRTTLDEPVAHDEPALDGDPWATLALPEDAPEIDDIDGT
ncbi:hypothetical protein [Micromonospora sp. NPDC000442]|uniref:hypothetical protein n=1 Tax=Micromonospora sp. NPDC000442 TaxID=3364217 RepID=UPI0036848685